VFLPLFKELICDAEKSVSMAIVCHLGTLCKVLEVDMIRESLVES
jgi:hypothetical protein